MKASIEIDNKTYSIDLTKPIDISIPLRAGANNPHAWYVDDVRMEPVMNEHFIGDVNKGGAVNFRNIFFNPHGHGTHTECVGHISKEAFSINEELKQFFFTCNVISIEPEKNINGDSVITEKLLHTKISNKQNAEAIAIRTIPNANEKLHKNYANTNPPYLSVDAIQCLLQKNINHLLIDQPSVDREVDGGKLAAHHAFWEYPERTQKHRTITEMIFVPNDIPDGFYLLNLQIASFENDASPSKPVLYSLNE